MHIFWRIANTLYYLEVIFGEENCIFSVDDRFPAFRDKQIILILTF